MVHCTINSGKTPVAMKRRGPRGPRFQTTEIGDARLLCGWREPKTSKELNIADAQVVVLPPIPADQANPNVPMELLRRRIAFKVFRGVRLVQ
jgi:hypothetical protein